MARRATAIAQLRQEHTNVLLLDSGDTLFSGGDPNAPENPDRGAWVIEAMNAMGYDAMAVGDWELNASLATVRARFEQAQFPILSANVQLEDMLPGVQPYILYQVGGHTIALIGVTSPQVGQWLVDLGLESAVQDPVEAVRQVVDKLAPSADIVILLSNLDRTETEALARAVPGIDAMIGIYAGVQREPLAMAGAPGQVVLHASGMAGEYLGLLTLQFDAQGQLMDFEGRAVALTDRYADDPQIVEMIRRYASLSSP
ncbi:MAG: hypothetical protein JXM73_14775 [Anaerolineae bacterium]|nr:hypothetical protein [Anaerolineae bacterium]